MGTRYPLSEFPLVIGRDSECGICIPENSVSRRHARIHPRSDGYYAEDLGSTNGTFVNDVVATMTASRTAITCALAIAFIASSWAAMSRPNITP